jgi:hypothetical protein
MRRFFAVRFLSIPANGWRSAVLTGLVLVACATNTPSAPPPPPLQSGMARVWFLRQAEPTVGFIYAAQPVVYVDRQPLTTIAQGTAFYHDFAPGRYRLSAQSVAGATYSGQHDILHLEPGEETYVQVIAVGNWEVGSPVGGFTFAVLPMPPNVAKAYLPTLADLGQR